MQEVFIYISLHKKKTELSFNLKKYEQICPPHECLVSHLKIMWNKAELNI